MPLLIICGLPSGGKSTRAQQLHDFFVVKGKKVQILSENVAVAKAGYDKNEFFADSQKEKIVRADLKSEAIRSLNKDDVIILDAANYIKGYRYEIYCATKGLRTTQATLYCAITKEEAWDMNLKKEQMTNCDDLNNSNVPYTREIFDALCLRFEEPQHNSRWDSPLFTVFPNDELGMEQIYCALFESKPPPPNQSTQNAPLSATNYLFELDRVTQTITNQVIAARKIGLMGPVRIDGLKDLQVEVPSDLNAIQLNRMRRQFMTYSKMHTQSTGQLDNVPTLFVQFLNANCRK